MSGLCRVETVNEVDVIRCTFLEIACSVRQWVQLRRTRNLVVTSLEDSWSSMEYCIRELKHEL